MTPLAVWGSDHAPEEPPAWTGSRRGRNRIHCSNLGAKRPSKTYLRKEMTR